MASKLLLVDGYSMAFRAFYGVPVDNFVTSTGQHTNAVYGFFSMFLQVVKLHHPTHIAVAWDAARESFRTVKYPDYKATRSAAPPEFAGQAQLIREILDAAHIIHLEKADYEADDIIATLAAQGALNGMKVLLYSGDRDLIQLVTPDVNLLWPGRGVGGPQVMGPAEVQAKYDVSPERYPELAALVGETSDNLPGVPGVGPKTAAKWIKEFDGLDNLLAHVSEVSGKVGESLRSHVADVLRNRELNALVTTLNLPYEPADLRLCPVDAAAINRLFDALQIRHLRYELLAVLGTDLPVAANRSESRVIRSSQLLAPGELSEWLATHANATHADATDATATHADATDVSATDVSATHADVTDATATDADVTDAIATHADVTDVDVTDVSATHADVTDATATDADVTDAIATHGGEVIGVDFVGSWGRGVGDITSVALADATGAVWVDVAALTPVDDAALANWLNCTTAPKTIHGAKGPLLACWQRGWDMQGIVSDTELVAYLLRPDQRVYSLDSLSQQFLQHSLVSATAEPASAQGMLDFARSNDTTREESTARAGTVLDLSIALSKELDLVDEQLLFTNIELPLTRVLAKMEAIGINSDLVLMERLRSDLNDRATTAEQAAYRIIGKQVNLSSPKQLQVLLFDELGMPKTKKIKTGYTTDAEALAELHTKTEHPFLAHLLAYRDAVKLRQMVDTLLNSVTDDGRIHTTFQQTVAGTGRLSSVDPNLQNIPVRTEEGRRVRETFVAGADYDGLLSVDYSQIEMRVMADASGDAQLIEAFRSGIDFHTVTASRVFGIPESEVTPQQRSSVKQMNYGLAYGLSAYGLASRLAVSVGVAKSLMKDYFNTFAGVRDYLHSVVDEARQVGYTQTRFGRRRYLPDLNSANYQLREMAERAALNAPIQGTAADIIKVAMLRVDAALTAAKLRSRMLLQIHDELLFEVAPGEQELLQTVVSDVMRSAVDLAVPLEVAVGFGASWAAAAH
ncbi:MAG: DNA polymerase I [Propionibacteriaceae bacterium]|jgi:DNA polymerase-1|nr:DNA polymerase I [Propionibacteriaceae bacterium]